MNFSRNGYKKFGQKFRHCKRRSATEFPLRLSSELKAIAPGELRYRNLPASNAAERKINKSFENAPEKSSVDRRQDVEERSVHEVRKHRRTPQPTKPQIAQKRLFQAARYF